MLLVWVEILVLLPTKLTDIAPSFCKQENKQSNLFPSFQHIQYRWLKSGNTAENKVTFTNGKETKKFKFVLIQKGESRDQDCDAKEDDGDFHLIKCFPAELFQVKLCF